VLILGIDTSGRQGSVALLQAQGEEVVRLGLATISGGQYSEGLVPGIAELLAGNGFARSAIGLIAVASGPGSFTGLRIAIATAKGLAEAHATPVVDVSVLEAIALASGGQGKVIAAMDAQRSEIFFGEYVVEGAGPEQRARMLREGLAGFADFTSLLNSGEAPQQKIFTPDEGLAVRLREAERDAVLIGRPSAEDFARIGYGKFLAGVRADVATLDANYLRRSDAELFSPAKPGTEPARH
jgi:tRNA threonylcarbamoyladenosine biosynthesis protein TsaB